MPWRRLSGPGLLYALGGVNIGIELVLSGADFGLWAWPWLRTQAFALGGFQPELFWGADPAFPGQAIAMFATYAFLHGGPGHLVGNILALATLGPPALQRLGARAFLAVYALAALAGGAAFALLAPDAGPMVGASGALFGIAGSLGALNPRQFPRLVLDLVILNAGLWFLTSGLLAWQAHLGGFVAGLSVTWGILAWRRNRLN